MRKTQELQADTALQQRIGEKRRLEGRRRMRGDSQAPADPLSARIDGMLSDLAARDSAVVALSGGVDSGVVAALARRALGTRAAAVTVATETLAASELEQARALAAEIGIEHEVVRYSDLEVAEFAANPAGRCYLCQRRRLGTVGELARRRGFAVVFDGTNASDPGPDRPGLRAVQELGVVSPLLEHGVDKATTRRIARHLGLSVWQRPANACLSSRIPHGETIHLGKLRRIEAAEAMLADLGFSLIRVRHLDGEARVEVGRTEVPRLVACWPLVASWLEHLGFRGATYAAGGYRQGGADRVRLRVAPG